MAIRVLIADPSSLIRAGIHHVIDSEEDVHIVGETGDDEEIIQLVSKIITNMMIIGPGFAEERLEKLIRDLRKNRFKCKVLVIDGQQGKSNMITLLKDGINVYVPVDEESDKIIETIHSFAKANTWLGPAISSTMTNGIKSSERSTDCSLTNREKEVLRLVANGETNKEIASRLYVSICTVEFHLGNIFKKLGVSRRVEAVL